MGKDNVSEKSLEREIYFSIFKSAIGSCGISWNEKGIVCFQLPESSKIKTRQRFIEKGYIRESSPPRWVHKTIDRIKRHLDGSVQDFSDVLLDIGNVPPFYLRVYNATRTIPSGQTKTYGQIAKQIQSPHAARAVGQALGRNPVGLIVPCHRVVSSSGKKLGGFSAFGGLATKAKLLKIERVILP